MGVDLDGIVSAKPIRFTELPRGVVAVDAYNALYQFLAVIRQPDGSPLTNAKGEVTSHLQGLFYRTINLFEVGVKPVYVFDGEVHELKRKELRARDERREKAAAQAVAAASEGRLEEARSKAAQAVRMNKPMAEQAKALLGYMGVPWVQAPFEGEAQAAKIARDGAAYACGSQDYDSLLFGAPKLLRNLTIAGKRKLPYRNRYVDVEPELVELELILRENNLTHAQLVDIGLLVGTDYNPDGFPGIGPKTALKLIREHGDLSSALAAKGLTPGFDVESLRNEFLNPRVSSNYSFRFGEPDEEAVKNYLCTENNFSEERVLQGLQRLRKALGEKQQSLEKWFGS
ncbi:MAG: flap endonuclease-1 [Candidatus Marsarchaeota archaeon]|nr:flap endonuclease-1 [Candidatus Marsarchaeota archaeon]